MNIFERILRFWIIKHILGPKRFSALLGFISGRDVPRWILRPLLKFFIWKYKIDISLFDIDIKKVKSFTDFFTRKFKKGQRTFEGKLISPAESVVTDFGKIETSHILSIKGMECHIDDLLNGESMYDNSSFAVFYLSPADYHRVHVPFDIKIDKIVYVPGDLYSVKPNRLEKNSTLFCDNRRVVMYGTSEFGKVAIIMVGALIVGRIVLNFGNRPKSRVNKVEEIKIDLKKGEELGTFELGSTVILLMENEILSNLTIHKGQHVLVGQDLT